MSLQRRLINLGLRAVQKPYLARQTDVIAARTRLEQIARFARRPRGWQVAAEAFGGVPVLAGTPPGAARGTLVYLHGGAFLLGSPETHLALALWIGAAAGTRVVLPRYGLAPERPFPAGLDDAVSVAQALPPPVVLAGESAGGGLVLGALASGLRPTAAAVVSPWADMTLSASSIAALAARDVFLPARRLAEVRDIYLAGKDPRDPRASPVFADLPDVPLLVLASRHEILRDDAVAVAARAGGTLELWPEVPHAWPVFRGWMPEADRAVARIGAFLRRAISSPGPRGPG